MLENYDKYQHIWQNHIDHVETVRNKLNFSAFNQSYKVNREQAKKGDRTMLDRVNEQGDKAKNANLMKHLFKPRLDHGINWQCSLR